MNDIAMPGIDLAKNVLQLHGAATDGRVVGRKQVRRAHLLNTITQLAPKTVAVEACAGAYQWSRRIISLGCQVRLIAPQFVILFVKIQKNDRDDAEAICEAALLPDDALCRAEDNRSAENPRIASTADRRGQDPDGRSQSAARHHG